MVISKTLNSDHLQGWVPRLLVYGDMGKHGGAESLGALVSEVEVGDTHAILHVGDFAYDFDSEGGVVSDIVNVRTNKDNM